MTRAGRTGSSLLPVTVTCFLPTSSPPPSLSTFIMDANASLLTEQSPSPSESESHISASATGHVSSLAAQSNHHHFTESQSHKVSHTPIQLLLHIGHHLCHFQIAISHFVARCHVLFAMKLVPMVLESSHQAPYISLSLFLSQAHSLIWLGNRPKIEELS